MKRWLSIIPAVALVAAAAGCASARARVVEEEPSLVVPAVPPRSIQPMPAPPAPAAEPPPEPAAPPPAPPRPKPTQKPVETKPEVKPDPPNPAVTQPPAPATTGTQLRTPTTPGGAEAATQVREILERVQKTLSTVNYQALTEEGRANYDRAKSFGQQSEDALSKQDYSLALRMATRAGEIAREFEGRRSPAENP